MVQIKTYNVLLDTKESVKNPSFVINTNDLQSVKLVILINQDGDPLDLTGATVRLAIKKPDKTTVLQDATIVDHVAGSCELVLTTQAYVVKGDYEAEVMVYYGSDTVAVTSDFKYTAKKGILSDDTLESTNEWQVLNQAVADANNTINKLRPDTVETFTATAGQTVFTLANAYDVGQNAISVEVDGVAQVLGSGYTETGAKSVTFSEGLGVGAKVRVIIHGLTPGEDTRVSSLNEQMATVTTSLAEKANQTDVRLNAVKLGQTDMTEEFLQQMAGTTPINAVPADKSISPTKTTFFKVGKNLFNKVTATYDFFVLETTGALSANTSYVASDYIPVDGNVIYTNNQGFRMAFYDSAKVFISGLANVVGADPSILTRTYTTPTNAKYVRTTWLKTKINTAQMELGSSVTSYEAYKEYIGNDKLEKFPIVANDLPLTAIEPKHTKFIHEGKNLFNKATRTLDYYVNYTTGALSANTSYDASDYISVLPNTEYTQNYSFMFAFYDINKVFISGLNTVNTGNDVRTFTTPSNCYFVRLSITKIRLDTFQSEKGNTYTGYEPYKITIDYLNGMATSFTPEITLPLTIQALTNKEINIYFQNILNDDISRYQIDVTCSIGKQQKERWTCVPNTAGTYSLTINVYREYTSIVASATTNIVVKADTVGNGINKKCIFIGDSTTNAAVYTGELVNLFGASDPMDITLLGSKGTAPNLHEGRAGWKASDYVTLASLTGDTNAFWNPGTTSFDFSYYMSQRGYSSVDYVGIHLGINDTFSYMDDTSLNTEITNILTRLQTMIDSIKAYSSSIKIGMMVTIPPSMSQDAFATSYANGQTQWRYKRNNLIWAKSFINYFKGKEAQNIYLVPINVNLDTDNNMVTVTVPVNSRNSKTVVRQDNGVHPANEGYYQMADVIYYWLKGFEV